MLQTQKSRPVPRHGGRPFAPLRDPLYRSSYALVANTAATTTLGVAYWAIAAHFYGRQTVGRSAALVSALILVSTFAQLNLANTLPRFIPKAGRSAGKFIGYSYAASSCAALVGGLAFVTVLPRLSSQWHFVRNSPPLAVAFVAAAVIWGIFALQDVVLLSLRRPLLVPAENFVYGVCKLLMLVGVVWSLHSTGIFFSWVVPLAITVPAVNWLIFRRYLKERHAVAAPSELRAREVVRFASVDYIGNVLTQASGNLLPLLVLSTLGATANSGFFIAWTIASGLGLVALNFGTSLLVEGAAAPHRLAELTRGVLVRCMLVTSLGAALLVLAARPILRVYGSGYAAHTPALLALLSLGTIPSCLVVIAISLDRIAGRVGRATSTRLVLTVLVLGGSWILVKREGIDGVALAWGGANLFVALVRSPTIVGAARPRKAVASPTVPAPLPGEPEPAVPIRSHPSSSHRHRSAGRHRVGTLRVDLTERPVRVHRPVESPAARAPAFSSATDPSGDTARAIQLLISMSKEAGFPS